MKFARLIVLGFVGSLLVYGGCGGGDKARPLGDNLGGHHDSGTTTTTHHPTPHPDASTGNNAPDAMMSTGDAATDGGDAGPVYLAANCGALSCVGTKKCVQDSKGAYCDCDPGFVKEYGDGSLEFTCKLDKTCVIERGIGCVQNRGVDPIVASFFSVEYCGGVPLPRDAVGDPAQAFNNLLEDDQAIDLTESAATFIPAGAELFVTLAIDVSGSVLSNPQVLTPLVSQLHDFVGKLEQPAGAPPVTVSVLVFGRSVAEYVAPTTNLQRVQTALQDFIDNPVKVTRLVQSNGTALFSAVKDGINATERLMGLRSEVTGGGVISSGTLVVVTDGNNESGALMLDKNQITHSIVHVISVGIDAAIDDLQLSAIGRDGSFLAPSPSDWRASFNEIAARINAQPDSIYRVAYCSPSTTGKHKLTVQYSGAPGFKLNCDFDAGYFYEVPPVQPDSGLLPPDAFASCKEAMQHICDNVDPSNTVRRCGGSMPGCGYQCLPTECCDGNGFCAAPSPLPPGNNCFQQDELCRPGNQRCSDTKTKDGNIEIFECLDPTKNGGDCTTVGCEEGVGQCIDKVCQPVTLDLSDECYLKEPGTTKAVQDSAHECKTLNCAKDPLVHDNVYYCRDPARMFDPCGGTDASAVCETGTGCSGNICKQRLVDGLPCIGNSDCASGYCGVDIKTCGRSLTCHFSWADKVTQ